MTDHSKQMAEVTVPAEGQKSSPESKSIADNPQIQIKWRENEAAIAFVDQFLIRRQGNQLFLLAGQVGLPLMTGSLEEQVEHASITELPVFICGKFVMERGTAEGLVEVLNKILANWEE